MIFHSYVKLPEGIHGLGWSEQITGTPKILHPQFCLIPLHILLLIPALEYTNTHTHAYIYICILLCNIVYIIHMMSILYLIPHSRREKSWSMWHVSPPPCGRRRGTCIGREWTACTRTAQLPIAPWFFSVDQWVESPNMVGCWGI